MDKKWKKNFQLCPSKRDIKYHSIYRTAKGFTSGRIALHFHTQVGAIFTYTKSGFSLKNSSNDIVRGMDASTEVSSCFNLAVMVANVEDIF